jgi:uncharacterized protein
MKFLVVALVVGVLVWLLTAKARPRQGGGTGDARRPPGKTPATMLACAHCGLHLPAADAVLDGSRVYCSEAHQRLGPRP